MYQSLRSLVPYNNTGFVVPSGDFTVQNLPRKSFTYQYMYIGVIFFIIQRICCFYDETITHEITSLIVVAPGKGCIFWTMHSRPSYVISYFLRYCYGVMYIGAIMRGDKLKPRFLPDNAETRNNPKSQYYLTFRPFFRGQQCNTYYVCDSRPRSNLGHYAAKVFEISSDFRIF